MPKPTALILVIVIVAFAIVFGVVYIFAIQPFLSAEDPTNTPLPTSTLPTAAQTSRPTSTPTSNPTLTPMRDLSGTWKTNFPTKFNVKIDGIDVGSENRTMTWTIIPTTEESKVDVLVAFVSTGRELVPDSGYTPDVSPMFLSGTISGTRLVLTTDSDYYNEPVGEFNFTTDIITGTWHDHWTLVYEQNVYTATNGLVLTRQ